MSEITYYSTVGFYEMYDIIIFTALPFYKVTTIPELIQITNKKPKIIIYCCALKKSLEILIEYLPHIKSDFVIITCMEDSTFPNDYDSDSINSIMNNRNFKHWFVINKVIPNSSQLTTIPYGIDYWSLVFRLKQNITIKEQDIIFNNIITNSKNLSERIPKIYATWHISITDSRHGGMRIKLPSIIPPELVYYEDSKIPMFEYWKKTSEYAFVVSPFGNGYDRIRTFEALCLGCIVIMQKCFLTELYHDLPVLFIDNWEDINEDLLVNTLKDFSTKTFNMEKLKMKYWTDLVFEKLNA